MIVWCIFLAIIIFVIIWLIVKAKKRRDLVRKYSSDEVMEGMNKKEMAECLLERANCFMEQKMYDEALQCIKESELLDYNGKHPVLYYKYYKIVGDLTNKEYNQRIALERGIPEIDVVLAATALEKDDLVDAAFHCNKALRNNAYGAEQLWKIISKRKTEKAALENDREKKEIERTLEENRTAIERAEKISKEERKYIRAAELYATAYNKLKKAVGSRVEYNDELAFLAVHAAVMHFEESCITREYNFETFEHNLKEWDEAYSWLKKENCEKFPQSYYVEAGLGYFWGRSSWAKTQAYRSYSLGLPQCFKYITKAAQAGVAGAEELRVEIEKAYKEYMDRKISVARMDKAEEEYFRKTHNNMTREEYEEQLSEKEANRRKIEEEIREKEQKTELQRKIEDGERDVDILSGGSGYTADEKALMGKISSAGYANYNFAKEKYIDENKQ